MARNIDLVGPFAFFGHSFGALLAFEVTHILQRENRPLPRVLGISAMPAPHFLESRYGNPRRSGADEVLINKLKAFDPRLGDAPPSAPGGLSLDGLRADLEMLNGYAFDHKGPLKTQIEAFFATHDPLVARHEVAAWSQHTVGSFHLTELGGDHGSIWARASVVAQVVSSYWGVATAAALMEHPQRGGLQGPW